MTSPSWHKVRLDLYKSLRAQCESILGQTDQEIAKYQRDYQKEIEREWSVSSVKDLIHSTQDANVLLLGDFHALYQSQKGHLRVLRLLPRARPKLLFIEFISAKDQLILDAYMRGEISDRVFLKEVRWKESWGFSWRSYKPILVWAKKRRVPVIALDKALKVHGDQSLHERDAFAADIISSHLKNRADHLGIVIIGDYHISSRHLPAEIRKRIKGVKINRIFQNSENIYFYLATQGKEFEVDVIRFSPSDFGLVSVAPWVKWHSLLMHLESQIEGDSELYHQVQDEVLRFYRVLKSDLGTPDLDEDFEAVSITDPSAFTKIESSLQHEEIKLAESYIQSGISFYIPQLKLAIISKVSLNYAAEAAMSVWHAKKTKRSTFLFDQKQSFYQLVWSFCIAYYGSKLINPKRKTDTIYDIRMSLKNSKKDKKIFRQIVRLKTFEWLWLAGLESKKQFQLSVPKADQTLIAKEMGAMAGEKLYYLYRRKHFKLEKVLDYLSAPLDEWSDMYFKLIAEMDKYPDPFVSKRLKI